MNQVITERAYLPPNACKDVLVQHQTFSYTINTTTDRVESPEKSEEWAVRIYPKHNEDDLFQGEGRKVSVNYLTHYDLQLVNDKKMEILRVLSYAPEPFVEVSMKSKICAQPKEKVIIFSSVKKSFNSTVSSQDSAQKLRKSVESNASSTENPLADEETKDEVLVNVNSSSVLKTCSNEDAMPGDENTVPVEAREDECPEVAVTEEEPIRESPSAVDESEESLYQLFVDCVSDATIESIEPSMDTEHETEEVSQVEESTKDASPDRIDSSQDATSRSTDSITDTEIKDPKSESSSPVEESTKDASPDRIDVTGGSTDSIMDKEIQEPKSESPSPVEEFKNETVPDSVDVSQNTTTESNFSNCDMQHKTNSRAPVAESENAAVSDVHSLNHATIRPAALIAKNSNSARCFIEVSAEPCTALQFTGIVCLCLFLGVCMAFTLYEKEPTHLVLNLNLKNFDHRESHIMYQESVLQMYILATKRNLYDVQQLSIKILEESKGANVEILRMVQNEAIEDLEKLLPFDSYT